MSIKWVPSSEIPDATPGKAGGIVAVIVSADGLEKLVTAREYRVLDHETAQALHLWTEIRFLQPTDVHPDDYRVLYPEFRDLIDDEIKKRLEQSSQGKPAPHL